MKAIAHPKNLLSLNAKCVVTPMLCKSCIQLPMTGKNTRFVAKNAKRYFTKLNSR
jgi:hypothetical protein